MGARSLLADRGSCDLCDQSAPGERQRGRREGEVTDPVPAAGSGPEDREPPQPDREHCDQDLRRHEHRHRGSESGECCDGWAEATECAAENTEDDAHDDEHDRGVENQRQRDRQPRSDQARHRLLVRERCPEITAHSVGQPVGVSNDQWPVEPELASKRGVLLVGAATAEHREHGIAGSQSDGDEEHEARDDHGRDRWHQSPGEAGGDRTRPPPRPCDRCRCHSSTVSSADPMAASDAELRYANDVVAPPRRSLRKTISLNCSTLIDRNSCS